MTKISIEVVTTIDRHRLLDALRQAISTLDGWIEDFRLFSNISIMISTVLPSRNAQEFAAMLMDIGLRPPAESIEALARETAGCTKDSEFLCALHVTFVHDDGDLRITVPAVPG